MQKWTRSAEQESPARPFPQEKTGPPEQSTQDVGSHSSHRPRPGSAPSDAGPPTAELPSRLTLQSQRRGLRKLENSPWERGQEMKRRPAHKGASETQACFSKGSGDRWSGGELGNLSNLHHFYFKKKVPFFPQNYAFS